jgi:hypothetical protein
MTSFISKFLKLTTLSFVAVIVIPHTPLIPNDVKDRFVLCPFIYNKINKGEFFNKEDKDKFINTHLQFLKKNQKPNECNDPIDSENTKQIIKSV